MMFLKFSALVLLSFFFIQTTEGVDLSDDVLTPEESRRLRFSTPRSSSTTRHIPTGTPQQENLREALRSNDLERIKIALEYGAKVNFNYYKHARHPRGKGQRPIHYAQSPEAVELLANAGATIDAQDINGRTALGYIVTGDSWDEKDKKTAEALVRAGASVHGNELNKPLFEVKSVGQAEFLLNAGVDPNATDSRGRTALLHVTSVELAEVFLNAGMDPNMTMNAPMKINGRSSTTPAEYNEHVEIALNLLKRERSISSCENVSGYSKLKQTQCGQRVLCRADMSCTFDIGLAPNSIQIKRTYNALCPALANGECPSEIQCVSDRSVLELVEAEEGGHQLSTTTSPSESGASQGER